MSRPRDVMWSRVIAAIVVLCVVANSGDAGEMVHTLRVEGVLRMPIEESVCIPLTATTD